MKYGLNLFSVRNLIQTEETFDDTVGKLKEMGYSYLQYSGAPFDAARIKRISEKHGMPVYLTHVSVDRILNDTKALIKEHASFGCANIGLGMMPFDVFTAGDESTCEQQIAALNGAGEIMLQYGCKFFYHHHYHEFLKIGEKTVFERLIASPYIHFVLDTYWLQYGGADMMKTIERLKGRIECVHLKDYAIVNNNRKIEPCFAPVGDGMLDFKEILEKMKKCGVKYYFVEQDNAADREDPLGEVERSIRYLKSLELGEDKQ